MYRAILPDGDIACANYERGEQGAELYTDDGTLIAFVPYANLVAVINADVERETERSIM